MSALRALWHVLSGRAAYERQQRFKADMARLAEEGERIRAMMERDAKLAIAAFEREWRP